MNNSSIKSNLVDTAASHGDFTIFGKAVNAAGLAQTLKADGPYTVFAPTDAAFHKLPNGRLENWLKLENKAELVAIINYHVSPGRILAADVGKLSETKTVQGQLAKIHMAGEKVMIDGANVTLTDIASSNGVIHAIDAVLLPTRH
ncbi:MAG TPA: fasciclin domain-containing protein [Rudaea sp.]